MLAPPGKKENEKRLGIGLRVKIVGFEECQSTNREE